MAERPDDVVQAVDPRFCSLFELNPHPVWSLDAEGRFVRSNAAMVRFIGLSEPELRRQTLWNLVHPSSFETLRNTFNECTTGLSKVMETDVLHPSGRTCHAQLILIPNLVNGVLQSFQGMFIDITDVHHMRVQLRDMPWFLDHAERIGQLGMFERNVQTNEIHWSHGIERIFALTHEDEMKVETLFRYIHPEDLPALTNAVKEAEKGIPYQLSCRIIRPDGMERRILIQCDPIVERSRGIRNVGVIQDITDRRHMEEALRVSQTQLSRAERTAETLLRESEQRFRSVIEFSADGIMVMDENMAVQNWNQAAERMFGYTEAEVLGKVPGFLLTRTSRRLIGRDLVNYLANQDSKLYRNTTEMIGSRKDGTEIPIEVSMTAWTLDESPVVAAVVRDLSERKRTEELVRKSDRLSGVSQIAAGLAHEIRNPLTAVKGFTQLLRSLPDVEYAHYFDIMHHELTHIELVLNELVILAKPQALQFQYADIEQTLNEVMILLRHLSATNHVTIRTEFAGDVPNIRCEKSQLKHAFMNVMKNAIEAMPQGGCLTVRLWSNSSHVIVEAIDEGMGISEDRLRTLGEPFYTTKEKGTGLGLTVSFKIIEAHGGRVEVTSQVDCGTTVSIHLPIGP